MPKYNLYACILDIDYLIYVLAKVRGDYNT